MKRLIAIICALLLTVGSVNVLGAETAVFEDSEKSERTILFEPGSYTVWYQVQNVSKPSDSSFAKGKYTKLSSKAGTESNGNFGSLNIVNGYKNSKNKSDYLGLTAEAVKDMTLRMKVKLDDVRNKNLKLVFCSVTDGDGNYVTAEDYTDDSKRRQYCDANGNSYIEIGEYVAETTEWQEIEVPLDLSHLTQVSYYPAKRAEADWTKATGIQVVSLNSDNATSDKENPAKSIEISYGDIYLTYGSYKYCTAEVKTENASGEIEKLRANEAVSSTITLKNETTLEHGGLAMFAVYKDKELIHLESKAIAIDGETSEVSHTFESYTMPANVSGMEVITYFWNEFVGMQAITAPLTVGGSL